MLCNSFALANCMIVNQNVDGAIFINNSLPRFFGLSNICKVSFVKMDVFEVDMACDSLGILDKLRRQIIADVNDD